MLVLTRKLNQEIIIQDNITVKILEISESGVKIGIQAPKSISVHRQEVYEEIQAENTRAAKTPLKFDIKGFIKGVA
ncbi:MAG: carbon storage regulator CsrA [Candidatus Margulisbacteria bacterium]|nr:carbon storage regulator CsrA [Candidatus Margulisiibacteriota bacterium]